MPSVSANSLNTYVFIIFVKLWNRPMEAMGADVVWRTNVVWMCFVSSACELELAAHALCYDKIMFSLLPSSKNEHSLFLSGVDYLIELIVI